MTLFIHQKKYVSNRFQWVCLTLIEYTEVNLTPINLEWHFSHLEQVGECSLFACIFYKHEVVKRIKKRSALTVGLLLVVCNRYSCVSTS